MKTLNLLSILVSAFLAIVVGIQQTLEPWGYQGKFSGVDGLILMFVLCIHLNVLHANREK